MILTPIRKHFYTSLIFVLFIASLNAQNPLDSLRTELTNASGTGRIDIQLLMARQLLYVSHNEASELLDEIRENSLNLDYDEGLCMSMVVRATLFMFQSKYDEAKKQYNEAIALAEELDYQQALAYGKLGLGGLYINKGEYALAYENHIEGLKSAKVLNNADLELTYLMNIGVIKQLLEEYDEAENYLTQAREIGEANELNHRLGQVFGNLGIIELKRKNYGLAIDYQTKAVGYFKELNAITQSAISYQNIGYCHAKLQNYAEADKAYDQSIEYRLASGDSLGYARGLRYKGELYLETDQLSRSDKLLAQALVIAERYKNDVLLSEIYELQSKAFELARNFNAALVAHRKFMTIKDSLTIRSNRSKISELTTEFELDKLAAENDLKASENLVKELKIRQKNIQLIGSLILLVMVVIWTVWKRKQLKNKLVLSEKDNQIARQQVALRSKQFEEEKASLLSYADQLLSKNHDLETKKQELEARLVENSDGQSEIEGLVIKLRDTINDENDWTAFRVYFDMVFPDFFEALKRYKALDFTMYEQRLLALIKIGLTNKEIARILIISRNSVVRAKYRLRQKFEFDETKAFEEFVVNL